MKYIQYLLSTILFSYAIACYAQIKEDSHNTSIPWTNYQPKVISFDLTFDKDKETLYRLLKSCWILSNDQTVSYKNVEINNDNICILSNKTDKIVINFDDFDSGLSVNKEQYLNKSQEMRVFYYLQLKNNFRFKFDHISLEKAKDLCDILYSLQHKFNVKNAEYQLKGFMPLVEQYRNANPKPSLSEEQRKYIVQANLFSQAKEYIKAAGVYKKVVEVNPIAYPEAYYNMSLLYAGERLFDMAILNMKKYVLLVPDASDARNAQDKIYEWEAMIAK